MQEPNLSPEELEQQIAYLQQEADAKRRQQATAESGIVGLAMKLMREPDDFIAFARKKLKGR
jgi:hypothetical protein